MSRKALFLLSKMVRWSLTFRWSLKFMVNLWVTSETQKPVPCSFLVPPETVIPSLVAAGRGCSSLRCTGFSWRWVLLLRGTGCKHAGFSSCGLVGFRVQAPRHVESSQTRVLSTSGFLSIAPPGKSLFLIFSRNLHTILHYGCPNLHSHEQYTRFLFLYVLSHTCYLLFFDKKPF